MILIAFMMLYSYYHYLIWKLLHYPCYRLTICWKFLSWNLSIQCDGIRTWGLQKAILIRWSQKGRILMGGTMCNSWENLLPLSALSHLRRQWEAERMQPGRGLPPEYADGSDGKESACSVGDLGWIPVLGRSPGGRHGNPLQYSHLENPMDRGAWLATIYGVTKSRTRLSN